MPPESTPPLHTAGGQALRKCGDEVNQRYKIERPLGQGAMGEVYVATDLAQNGRQIAIKYLKWKMEKEDALEKFKSEFATLTHLSHPHIAKVYDFEQDTMSGSFFFTSELIQGRDFINAAKGESVERIEELFVQALRALEYLHSNGIFHFDIKAANLLVSEEAQNLKENILYGAKGSVKLIDFGLSSIRFLGGVVGTPSYMAPEMIRRTDPDGRSDLYSLGVLVYSALTGINPFRSIDHGVTMQNQLKLFPPKPSSKNDEIPAYLDDVIMKLLEKRAEDRYQTAGQAIRDLSLRGPKRYEVETDDTKESYIPLESKFIGRKAEIDKLKDLFTERKPAVVVVSGAFGAGKTRLLNEAKYLAQIEEWATFFLTDASKISEWRQDVLSKQSRPMLVGIDDYHVITFELWGEQVAETCRLLAKRIDIGRSTAAPPIILMITAEENFVRPELVERRTGEAIPRDAISIHLSNFTIDEIKEYLSAITGLLEIPQNIVELINTNTGGNPLVVTEVVKALVTGGMLVDAQGRWKGTTFEDIKINLDRLQIPSNLEEYLLKDYLNLPQSARSTADMMAVIERPVKIGEIPSPLGGEGKGDGLSARTALLLLVKRGLVKPHAQDGTYFFTRPILAKAIYRRMPKPDRLRWHDKIAEQQVASHPERSEGSPARREELLYHLSRGSNEAAAKKALRELIGLQMNAYRNFDAIANVQFYLEHWNEPDIRLELAKLYNRVGKYNLAIETAETIGTIAPSDHRTIAPVDLEVSALEIIGIAYLRQMNFNAARQHFFAALQTASDMPLPKKLRIENFIAEVAYFEGNISKAIEIYERNAEAASMLTREEQIQITNNNLGQAYYQKGEYKKAIDRLKQDIILYKDTANKRLIARMQYILAEAYHAAGQFDAALKNYNTLLDYSKSTDDFEHLFRAYNGIGSLYLHNEKFAEAVEYYERALDVSSRLGFEEYSISCITNLGITSSNMGDLKKAEEYLSSALAYFEGSRAAGGLMEQYHCRVHLELGEVCRQKKRFDDARKHLEDAALLAKSPASSDLQFWIRLTQLKLAIDEGDNLAANCLLDEAKSLANTKEKQAKLAECVK